MDKGSIIEKGAQKNTRANPFRFALVFSENRLQPPGPADIRLTLLPALGDPEAQDRPLQCRLGPGEVDLFLGAGFGQALLGPL